MTIKQTFTSLSTLIVIAFASMAGLLWYETQTISTLGKRLALSKELSNDLLMLRRHEKDFLLRKQTKYIETFSSRMDLMRGKMDLLESVLNPQLKQRIAGSYDDLDQYERHFLALVELDKHIGLSAQEGLRMRFNLAEETLHNSLMDLGDIHAMSDALRLVLLEHNFQTTLDTQYKQKMSQQLSVIRAHYEDNQNIGKADLIDFEDAAKSLTKALIDRGLNANEGLRGELRASIHKVEKTMDELSTDIATNIESDLDSAQRFGMTLASFLTALIAGLLLWQGYKITSRLKTANSKMATITQGEGDLTHHIDLKGNDEVTDFTGSVNKFIDTTADIVREIKHTGEHVEEGAHHSVELTKRAQNAIAEQKDNTLAVKQAVSELVNAVSLIAENSVSVQTKINDAEVNMAQSTDIVQKAHKDMAELTGHINHNSELMQQLTSASADIEKVTAVIRGITEQTNLLALNAAIEAARAGESGRGFAVVADEVRTLAKRTQSSTVDIERMIQDLQSLVTNSESAMKTSLSLSHVMYEALTKAQDKIIENKQSMDEIRDMIIMIAGATEEQMATVKGVEDAAANISVSAEQLYIDSNSNRKNCEHLEFDAHKMQQDVARFKV